MPLAFDAAQLPKAYDLRQARIELDRLAAAWTPPEGMSLPDPTQTQALLNAIFAWLCAYPSRCDRDRVARGCLNTPGGYSHSREAS